ncbi:MAG TPA: hypothetical protein VLH35_00610 [Candidatus Acidoferrales bacterium]|nr:hypothetical protein [Candidatus Acidoferrales bacterium]
MKKILITVLLIVLFSTALLSIPSTTCQGSAQSAINLAKNTLKTCYQAVVAAESAGANVALLMVTINQATDLLSQAELANEAQDYDAAYRYASQSQSKLNGLTNQAATLEQEAILAAAQNSQSKMLTLLVSFVIFVSGVSAWFMLYRRERRSIRGAPAV